MSRKTITVLFGLLLALSMTANVFGGGGGQKAGTAAGGGADYAVTEPIKIEWWHSLENQYNPTAEKVVQSFNASQNLITVEARYVGSYAILNENLLTAHVAGVGLPGITVANTPVVAAYGEGGLCETLDPYIKASNFPLNDFGTGIIKATQYEGKQIALPFLISTQVIYYNKDLAKSMGVQIPDTWNEMDAFLKSAYRKTGNETTLWAYIQPGWDQAYYQTYYLNNGVKIINPDGKTTDLDSPKAIEIAQKFKDWCDAGYIYWASGQNASNIMRQNFWDGKTLSIVHTSSLYNTHVDNCKFDVGMVYLPGQNTRISEIGGSAIVIPSKADQKSKNAGWKFMEYLLSPDINMIWAKETGYLPIRKSAVNGPAGQQFLAEKPEFKKILDNIDNIQPRIQHPAWAELARIWMANMAETINENKNVSEMMKKMAVEINEALNN